MSSPSTIPDAIVGHALGMTKMEILVKEIRS